MTALYAVQLKTRDAGIVDFGWAFGLGACALAYALYGEGAPIFRMAMAAMAVPWSLRLALYILRDRVVRGGEDARYHRLRQLWGPRAPYKFFLVFLTQAMLIVLLSVPFMAVANQTGEFRWHHALGLLIGWGAILGETVADRQLQRWRKDPANAGKTCRSGLWRYSRHPNYFFEWLHWWGYVALCVPAWQSMLALIGPVLMFLFLYRITGIPFAEAQAVHSRGDDYRAYQRETPAFFPWFPRGPGA
jgi:steroid 5-alpha reductase family enzyme